MLKIALGLGGIWIVGFVVIVAISLRKHFRRKKREKANEVAYFKQVGEQNK